MRLCSILLAVAALSLAGPAKPAAKKPPPSSKVAAAGKSASPGKPAKAATTKAGAGTPATSKGASKNAIEDADNFCRKALAWGRVQAVRDRCGDLEPRSSATSAFWRLSLSDDPNDLRKGFAPQSLAKSEVDARLLLAAGRYHFARGQRKELEDLVELARKQKIAGKDIDTLKRLARGG